MKISALAMWAKTTRHVGQVRPHSEHVMIHYSPCGPVTHLLHFPLLAMWAPIKLPERFVTGRVWECSFLLRFIGGNGQGMDGKTRAAPKRPPRTRKPTCFYRLDSDQIEER